VSLPLRESNDRGEGDEGQKACLSLRDPNDCIKQAKNDKRKNVILNEVKNLCGWLTFCYDAILHFVQNVP